MSGDPMTGSALRAALKSRSIARVVVLGANGTMGFGSAALFTQAIPEVTFLARTREKAEEGLQGAISQVRSPTVASRARCGSYDEDLDASLEQADFIFEALTEDFGIKKQMFDRVEKARHKDSIVGTVTSGLSINGLCEGRDESFRRNFLGLHLFNPPNVIVGTELVCNQDTDPEVADFVEAFSRLRLGREIIRTADTPAFAGNRVGFKVLNEAALLAEDLGPALVDQIIGPYTGRALTPLATVDLVGWDIHRAIVDNVYQNTSDEAHASNRMPDYMARLIEQGVLGNKSGAGFFKRDGKTRLALDPRSGDYTPVAELNLPELPFIAEISTLYREGRYRDGMALFLAAEGDEARIAKKVVAGYISYAFHRVGEVTETLNGIDRIMGTGFNWAPPGVLVDLMGPAAACEMIAAADVPVPAALETAAKSGTTEPFFHHPTISRGKFLVAS